MPSNAYTISNLATDAGISVHRVRNYELRGLLCACEYTSGGYRIYDKHALERLHFIRAGMAAGITLDAVGALLKSLDNENLHHLDRLVGDIDQYLAQQMDCNKQFSQLLKILVSKRVVPNTSLI